MRILIFIVTLLLLVLLSSGVATAHTEETRYGLPDVTLVQLEEMMPLGMVSLIETHCEISLFSRMHLEELKGNDPIDLARAWWEFDDVDTNDFQIWKEWMIFECKCDIIEEFLEEELFDETP